ncbi:unnamed protein product [Rotaria socialis]|uniref:Arb2 domain-containing protein n=1 Tax=Rotaria socialis TaxID=392032 RepID=A0A817LE44_9BILA|nr:unnamed protein product [Rotaria socialis]CAF3322305.1 unnamed protein product [Rotaria socialis]CAF4239783.1 unnamed protein product [Rotaria socialis]CAF4249521.1 unnamed protein product [Rotaria socialis]
MKNNPWNYEEIWLAIEQHDRHYANIFVSNDFRTNQNGCLILIQGLSVVRAGQWSRACCINESLDIGAMFPYVTKAKEHNLSVIILNRNQTSYIDKETYSNHEDTKASSENLHSFYLSPDSLPLLSSTKPVSNLSTSYEHFLYVYDNIIAKMSPTEKFYIVAHSAGGDNLTYLLRQRQDCILSKLSKIVFIDAFHAIISSDTDEIKKKFQYNALHFIASDKPMGESIHFSQKPFCSEISLITAMFSKKPSVTEQAKAHSRELRTTDRDLIRDRRKIEAEEQRLMNEIRKAATTNNKKAVEILAKQLVKVRNQKDKSLQASGQIQSLASQSTMMASNVRMAGAMETTAKTMSKMNKVMNPEQMSKISQQFVQEHTKFAITDDMIGESLEAALGQEGDSEEEDAIVNQVLDEIGISLNDKIANAPHVPAAASSVAASRKQANDEDADIERMLANLRS